MEGKRKKKKKKTKTQGPAITPRAIVRCSGRPATLWRGREKPQQREKKNRKKKNWTSTSG